MKSLFKILFVFIFILESNVSRANTLFDSLNSAYLNNPKLNAERANMRASREEKRESVSEFLPSVTISGYVSEQDNTGTDGSDSNFKPAEQSITVEQKIFQGGSGVANFIKKKRPTAQKPICWGKNKKECANLTCSKKPSTCWCIPAPPPSN